MRVTYVPDGRVGDWWPNGPVENPFVVKPGGGVLVVHGPGDAGRVFRLSPGRDGHAIRGAAGRATRSSSNRTTDLAERRGSDAIGNRFTRAFWTTSRDFDPANPTRLEFVVVFFL